MHDADVGLADVDEATGKFSADEFEGGDVAGGFTHGVIVAGKLIANV